VATVALGHRVDRADRDGVVSVVWLVQLLASR